MSPFFEALLTASHNSIPGKIIQVKNINSLFTYLKLIPGPAISDLQMAPMMTTLRKEFKFSAKAYFWPCKPIYCNDIIISFYLSKSC